MLITKEFPDTAVAPKYTNLNLLNNFSYTCQIVHVPLDLILVNTTKPFLLMPHTLVLSCNLKVLCMCQLEKKGWVQYDAYCRQTSPDAEL